MGTLVIAVAVKAEFEAEGTRTDELLRLLDLTEELIGALIQELVDVRLTRGLLGLNNSVLTIIAPMVETQQRS